MTALIFKNTDFYYVYAQMTFFVHTIIHADYKVTLIIPRCFQRKERGKM